VDGDGRSPRVGRTTFTRSITVRVDTRAFFCVEETPAEIKGSAGEIAFGFFSSVLIFPVHSPSPSHSLPLSILHGPCSVHYKPRRSSSCNRIVPVDRVTVVQDDV